MARPVEKRAHIERGVVEVIAKKGLRGTTIQDIANAASVSPGLLYRYWENRDELAAEVYRRHLRDLVEHLIAVAVGNATFLAQASAMVKYFLEFADREPTLLKFLLLSQHDLAPSVPAEMGVHGLVRRLISDGQARGELRPLNPDVAVAFLLGAVLQPALSCIYGVLPGPLCEHHAEIVDALDRLLSRKPASNGSTAGKQTGARA